MSKDSLMDELLQHSMDSAISVSQLVRYCNILADNIEDEEMAAWCDAELDGHEKTPEYRKVYGRLTAQDVYNRTTLVGFENHSTSDEYSTVHLRMSISDIEDMVNSAKPGSSYQFMFPDRLAQNLIKENPHVISVYWIVQVQAFSKIIQHVRNHIFKWAKSLKKSGTVPLGKLPKLNFKSEVKSPNQITINTSTFNAASVGTGATFESSPIQVANVNSVQNIQYETSDLKALDSKFDELLKYLAAVQMTQEITQLVDEINTFKGLINQPKQRPSWITETLTTIRGILENATGTVLASYADKVHLIDIIGRSMGLA